MSLPKSCYSLIKTILKMEGKCEAEMVNGK